MIIKKFIFIFILFFTSQNYVYASNVYFLDFKYILNQSEAGKKAQDFLKKKLEQGAKNIENKEKKILSEEKKIIEQKKIISKEEYKKKVTELRSKVSSLQKERGNLMRGVADKRTKARNELLKNLNPIVKKYMIDNNIQVVLDKKNILLADDNLDITNDIIVSLNKKIKTLKLD